MLETSEKCGSFSAESFSGDVDGGVFGVGGRVEETREIEALDRSGFVNQPTVVEM